MSKFKRRTKSLNIVERDFEDFEKFEKICEMEWMPFSRKIAELVKKEVKRKKKLFE